MYEWVETLLTPWSWKPSVLKSTEVYSAGGLNVSGRLTDPAGFGSQRHVLWRSRCSIKSEFAINVLVEPRSRLCKAQAVGDWVHWKAVWEGSVNWFLTNFACPQYRLDNFRLNSTHWIFTPQLSPQATDVHGRLTRFVFNYSGEIEEISSPASTIIRQRNRIIKCS